MAGTPENLSLRASLEAKETEPTQQNYAPRAAEPEPVTPEQLTTKPEIPPAPPKPAGVFDELVRGLKTAGANRKAAEAANRARRAELAGNLARRDAFMLEAYGHLQDAERVAPTVRSYKDVDDLGSAIRYGLGLTGQAAPSVVQSIAMGALGRAGAPIARQAIPGFRRATKLTDKFDVIFLDPPYQGEADGTAPAVGALTAIGGSNLVREGGAVLVQHAARVDLPPSAPALGFVKRRNYGETALTLYRALRV